METAEHLELFIKGSIVGLLIGDALGYPWSDMDRSNIPNEIDMLGGPSGEQPGEYTSLGASALCVTASFCECGDLDLEDIIEKFYDLYIAGYMTSDGECYDVGPTTTQALKNFANGMPTDRTGLKAEESNDADCLPRILPISLFYAKESIDTLLEASHAICSITHAHPRSQVACAIYAVIIRNLLLQRAEKAFDLIGDYYQTKGMEEYFAELEHLRNWSTNNQCSGSSQVEDCFWSAWKSFSSNENDYAFSVWRAIRFGNDTNATAAISGTLSALKNGLNDIPARWCRTIRLTPEVMEVVMNFVEITAKRLT